MKHPDARLRAYCDLVVSEPTSVTAVREAGRAWEVLVEDALAAAELVRGLAPPDAVDVGSGGGSPGIPLALSLARRVRRHEGERAQLMSLSLTASERERRAIAADLHDGPVQDQVEVVFVGSAVLSVIDS